MILITRFEAVYLRNKNLGHFVKTLNKAHKSAHKSYYLVEDPAVLKCLQNKKINIQD